MKNALTSSTLLALLSLNAATYALPLKAEKKLSLSDLLNVKVSVASKNAENIQDAPGIISVVTHEDWEKRNLHTLRDAFLLLPGTAPQAGAFGAQVLNMRGDPLVSFPTHILVLVDGKPIRGGGIQENILRNYPLDAVEQIEVIRGPGSVLYGSNAYTGVVNIVLKKAEATEYSVRYTGRGSTYAYDQNGQAAFQIVPSADLRLSGALTGSLLMDNRINSVDYWATSKNKIAYAGAVKKAQALNQPIPPKPNLDAYHDLNNYEKGFGAQAAIDYKNLNVQFMSMRHGMAVSGLYGIALENDFSRQMLNEHFVSAKYLQPISEELSVNLSGAFHRENTERDEVGGYSWEIKNQNYEASINYNHDNLSLVAGGIYEYQSDFGSADFVASGADAEMYSYVKGTIIATKLKSPKADSIAAAEYIKYIQSGAQSLPAQKITPNYANYGRYVGYLQAGYRLFDRYKLIGGLQVNKSELQDLDLVPRAGLVINVSDDLYIKGLFAGAYRAPTSAEMFAASPIAWGNPNLKPEKNYTTDVQVGYKFSDWLSTDLTYFHQMQKDMIARRNATAADAAQFPNAFTLYDNVNSVNIDGLEFQATALLGESIKLNTSHTYSYVQIEDKVNHQKFVDAGFAPSYVGKLLADIKLPAEFSLTADAMYIREFIKDNYIPFLQAQAAGKTVLSSNFQEDPAILLTSKLFWNVGEFLGMSKGEYRIHLGVDNILDQAYYSGFAPGNQTDGWRANEGRKYEGGIQVKF